MNALAEDLFNFVGDVARASAMDELEQRYLDGVGHFLSSSAAGIYVLNPFTHGAESIAARGVSDFFLSRYEEHGRHRDPVLKRILLDHRATHSGALMEVDQWTALPVYDEVFRLHRMTSLLEAPIVVDSSTVGTLNFGRTADEGGFDEDERRLADAIARLIGAALGSLRETHALARERNQLFAALELCREAVVVTDMHTAERRMNAAARQLLARLGDREASFDQLMANPVRAGQQSRHELPVVLCDGSVSILVARSTHAVGDDAILVSFIDLLPERDCAPPEDSLLRAKLTPRELQVAELAARGLRDAEIASQLFLSPHTVKQYLKAVYGKAGVRSRVELARLMVGRRAEPDPDQAAG